MTLDETDKQRIARQALIVRDMALHIRIPANTGAKGRKQAVALPRAAKPRKPAGRA